MSIYSIYDLNGWRAISVRVFAEAVLDRGVDVVFFGEVHGRGWMIGCVVDYLKIVDELIGIGFLGLEMFNYRQQDLLDRWVEGKLDWNSLVDRYSRSREGFQLEVYKPLMEEARSRGIKIVGLMPPREEAMKISRLGLKAVEEIRDSPIRVNDIKISYQGYRDRFMELIPRHGPMTALNPENLLYAQAFKDTVIAKATAEALNRFGRGVTLTGWAHVEHIGTAPTRLIEFRSDTSYIVATSRDLDLESSIQEFRSLKNLLASYIVLKGSYT